MLIASATCLAGLTVPPAMAAAGPSMPTAPVTGQITGPNGPVAGARVLVSAGEHGYIDEAEADEHGRFAAAVPAGDYTIQGLPPADNLARLVAGEPEPLTVDGGGVAKDVTLLAATHVGLVHRANRGAEPTPYHGALVHALDYGSATYDTVTATSASDGSYALRLSPTLAYGVTAVPALTNPDLLGSASDYLSPSPGPEAPTLVLPLPTVTGTVLKPNGGRAAGALVELRNDGSPYVRDRFTATADGRFGFTAGAGSYDIVARPAAGSDASLAFGSSDAVVPDQAGEPVVPDVNVTLQQANTTGFVRGPDDQPVPGASVDVQDAHGRVLESTVTDSTGAWGAFLSAGSYRVVASPAQGATYDTLPGTASLTVTDPATAINGQDVKLRTANVVGRLVDPAGAPSPDARVRVTRADGSPAAAEVHHHVDTRTDDAGRFALLVPGPDHRIALQDSFPHFAPAPLPVTPAEGKQTDLGNVALVPATLAGTVRDSAGAGRWATLTVIDTGTRAVVHVGERRVTERDGRYALRLPAGHYRILATPSQTQEARADAAVSVSAGGGARLDLTVLRATDLPWVAERVSVSQTGGEADGGSQNPRITPSGSHVVFDSSATNLLASRVTGRQVYVRDVVAGRTEIVSVSTTGAPGSKGSYDSGGSAPMPGPTGAPDEQESEQQAQSMFPGVSDDGSLVVFVSDATNLVAGHTNDLRDVFLRDRADHTTVLLSRTSSGSANGASDSPAISGDGRFVAFASEATNLVAGVAPAPNRTHVYLLDRTTGQLTAPFAGAGDASTHPAFSGDGKKLFAHLHHPARAEETPPDPGIAVFASSMPTTDGWSVAVTNTAGDGVAAVARTSDTNLYDPPTSAPSPTTDGSAVAFASRAPVTVQDGTAELRGLLVPTMASLSAPGQWSVTTPPVFSDAPTAADGMHWSPPVLSADGATITFGARDAVGPTYWPQVWAAGVGEETTPARMVTLGPRGAGGDHFSYPRGATADGRQVLVQSHASDLVTNKREAENTSDVFLFRRNDDRTPPAWENAETALAATDTGTTLTRLTWTPATDVSGVANYRVLRDGAQVAETQDTTLLVTGLTPDTAYRFEVVAVDRAGNASAANPALQVRTHAKATEAFLLAVARPGGQVDLTWDLAGSGDSYRVYRTLPGTAPAVVATLPAGTGRHTDTGVPADTTASYEVRTVGTGGADTPHTRVATATTGPLSLAGIDLTVTPGPGGLAKLGSDVGIELRGEPHRSAQATVRYLTWFDGDALLDAPVPATATIPLTDSAEPGVYRGAFRLAEGVREVSGVTGVLTDGTGSGEPGDGHTRAAEATRIPITPAARIQVTLVAPEGTLAGSTVVVTGPSDRLTAKTDGAPAAADLAPGDEYVVSLLDRGHRKIGAMLGVRARPGLTSVVQLEAQLPASLQTTVTTEAGAPVAGASLRAQAADGTHLGWGVTDQAGVASLSGRLVSGDVVTLVLTPGREDALLASSTHVVTLTPGANTATISVPRRASGTVTGTVRDAAGKPVSAAVVTLSQDGMPRLEQQAVTDDTGRYTLTGLATAGVLRASSTGAGVTDTVTVPDGGTVDRDLTLQAPTLYRLRLDVFTRTPGSAYTGPAALTPGTAADMGLTVSAPSGTLGSWAVPSDGSNTLSLRGFAGDVAQVCVNGSTAFNVGRDRTCLTAPLGEQTDVTAELRLGPAARVVVPIEAADAAPYDGSWTATLSRRLSDGTWETHRTIDGSGRALRSDLPDGGTWRVAVSDGRAAGLAEVVIAEGSEPTTQAVRLREPKHLLAAPSTGTNAIIATRDNVRPGGLIDLRASVTNGAGGLQATVLRLGVPAGTTAVLGGVLVDGKPGTGVTAGAGVLDVPLGALDAGASRTVRYQVRVDAASATRSYTLAGELRYPLDGGTQAESLAPAAVTTETITLDAPRFATSDAVAVSGSALPDSSVRVYDGTTLLTTTAASAGGLWRANVTLPPRPVYAAHLLRAETDGEAGRLTSDPVLVRDDPDVATVTQLRVSQAVGRDPDGRTFAWDPRKGTARFPFVINPNYPTTVRVTFDKPELAGEVDVYFGTTAVRAERQDDGTWLAKGTGAVSGGISATWRKLPVPRPLGVPVEQRPSLADVRAELPPLFEGFEVLETTDSTVAADGTGSASATVSLPAAGEGSTMKITATRSDGSAYVPTADDLAAARRTGVALYGLDLQNEVSEDGTRLATRMTAYVPQSSLDGTSPGYPLHDQPVSAESLGEIRALGAADKLVKIGMDLTTDLATRNAADVGRDAVGAAQALGGGDKYQRIIKIRNSMKCPERHTRIAKYLDTTLPELAVKTDLVNAGAGLAGAVVATIGGPFGAAGALAGTQLLGKALDDNMNGFLDRAEKTVAYFNGHCDNNGGDVETGGRPAPDDGSGTGGTGPAGSPVWIYDPSGFVYDTVAADRIPGVTATLLFGATDEGPWSVWDADWYGQRNPLSTDAEGKYAWDVPEGWWMVQLDKPGYETTYSPALRVLPPQLDVNLAMVRTDAPRLTSAAVDGSDVVLTFDSWMDPTAVAAVDPATVTVTGPSEAPVPGTVTAIEAQPVPGTDRTAAKTFRFTPSAPLTPATTYDVRVAGTALSAHGRPTGGEASRQVTTAALPPDPAPGEATPPAADVTQTGATATLPAAGTLTTGGGQASPDNQVVTSVTSPQGGVVRIAEQPSSGGDRATAGYALLGQRVDITAPAATAQTPLTLAFRLDRSALPAAETADTVSVQRNGELVARSCAAAGRAEPDPCMLSRTADGDDVVLTVLTSAASVWTFLTPEPAGLAAACPGEPQVAPFHDAPAGSPHARAIECLQALRITQGIGGGRYGPAGSVPRGQMASFLAQLLTSSGYALPATPPDAFSDDEDSIHERYINALAATGIVTGLTDSAYGPRQHVTRAQMAAMLDRVYGLLGGTAGQGAPDRFRDDEESVHESAIDHLAALGVTTGVRADGYGPDLAVRRDQMASFLARLLSRLVAEGTVDLDR